MYHNTAAVIDADGSLMGVYRKMHIPDDPLFYEKFYFTPGDTGFIAWKTKVTTIGTLVCWDQWFPEGARLTAMQGAEILFYPTAIGWHPSERKQYGAAQHDSWEVMQRSHAIANGCYVCVPNRIGHEIIKDTKGKPVNKDGIVFWGQSFVASPDGQVVKRAPINKETVLIVDCDLAKVEFSRTHWPFLRDRRIDAYGAADQTLQRLGPQQAADGADVLKGTPAQHGFLISAGVGSAIEAPGSRWPRPEGISFPGKYHEAIEDIAGLIRVLVAREEVHLNVPNDNYERIVRDFLKARRIPMRRVFFHLIPTNEAWARDHGPAFVLRTRRGKTAGRDRRLGLQRVGRQVSALGCGRRGADAHRRGVEAAGVLPAHRHGRRRGRFQRRRHGDDDDVVPVEQESQTAGLSKQRIEKYLRDYYGQKHVIWLGEGIEGDDTDGHIDDLARFIDERTIAIGIETNKRDPNYAILQKARRALDKARDQDGNPFEIVELPMPRPIAYDGQRVPATYVNFYFANGVAARADVRPTRSRSKSDCRPSAPICRDAK